MRQWTLLMCVGAVACCGSGCLSVNAHKTLIGHAMAHDSERAKALEGTLLVMDEHPEYIDEMFQSVLEKHPKTLERFVENTTRELKQPGLSTLTAKYLAQHPDSLQQILTATIDAVATDEARQAISRAIDARAQKNVVAIASRPVAVKHLTHAMTLYVKDHPAAQKQFIAGMRQDRHLVMRMVADDPQALSDLVDALTDIATMDRAVADLVLDKTMARIGEGVMPEAAATAMEKHPEAALSLAKGASKTGIGGAAGVGIGNIPPIPQIRSGLKKLRPHHHKPPAASAPGTNAPDVNGPGAVDSTGAPGSQGAMGATTADGGIGAPDPSSDVDPRGAPGASAEDGGAAGVNGGGASETQRAPGSGSEPGRSP